MSIGYRWAGVTFDVYLDAVNPPMGKVANGLFEASFAPSLAMGIRYYWKVVAIDAAGHTDGPVWSFATHITGDINADGYVNVGDLQAMVAAWASQAGPPPIGNWNPSADINSDDYVNVGDLQLLVAHWGQSV